MEGVLCATIAALEVNMSLTHSLSLALHQFEFNVPHSHKFQ